jgi:tRNA1Val (adenine37-N6)-methyltransferase
MYQETMSTFRFQQFSVEQSQSAMKVCTDTTLFGAMMPICPGDTVLDIGSGTGVLSLMAAQLGAGHVTAVELTASAHSESQSNFRQSRWPDRLSGVHQDIQGYCKNCSERYDLIISNPPFFQQHSRSDESLRSIARHTDQLSYPELIVAAEKVSTQQTRLYLLLPVHAVRQFAGLARDMNFFLIDRVDFRGYGRNSPKVAALTFSRTPGYFISRVHTIYEADRIYSKESEHYLSPFLLRFSRD